MKTNETPTDINKILIIRNDGIGDMLNSTPAISALRVSYPNARISVFSKFPASEVLRFNPHVDEVIAHDDGGFLKKLKLVKQIRSNNYDLAVVLQNSSECNLLAYLSGAKYRLGRKGKRFSSMLTHRVELKDQKGTKHEVERNLDVVRLIGVKEIDQRLFFILSDEEKVLAREFLKHHGLMERFAGIHPGGSSFDKLWQAEKFAIISDKLHTEFGLDILLFCGPNEQNLVKEFKSKISVPFVLASQISLRMMSALIEKCSIFICNDSGPMHIASALNVPTVAIFGPTDHIRWGPLSENAIVVRKEVNCWPCSAHKCKSEFYCIKSLTVEEVWDGILKIMRS